jgi:hypothetical protein
MAVLLFVKPPAPAGIPVASTTQVNLTAPFNYLNGIHSKITSGSIVYGFEIIGAGVGYFSGGYGNAYQNFILSPNTSVYDHYGAQELIPSEAGWNLWYFGYDYENGQWYLDSKQSANASTNINYIPTAGWSPAITITAA